MLICYVLLYLSSFSGILSSAVVTLDSMRIYTTHEWLKSSKPIVYFTCKGENKTFLPDVKEVNVTYTFTGEESWQPLTQLKGVKCKRCGFYEKDTFKFDDVYDEWELCPSDFHNINGLYIRKKNNEFDATFFCPLCLLLGPDPLSAGSRAKGKGMRIAVIMLVCIMVSTVSVLVMLGLHKYWQKKKRQLDQARFLKLFEEGDDIEDELDGGI